MRLIALVTLFLLTGCAPQIQALFVPPLAPNQVALEALQSGSTVKVEQTAYGYAFIPANPAKGGFAFYPGGRVDLRAYSPILRRVAEAGYRVVLLEMPLSLAILDQGKAQTPIAANPELKWAVGGHSLGGVAAANFAADNPAVKGVVLWASFPQNDQSGLKIPTLALFGDQDGLINAERRAEESKKLSQGNTLTVIAGLNHAGFGGYGPQPDDKPATINPESGWDQVTALTVGFLERIF